jgi:hypothetical protein
MTVMTLPKSVKKLLMPGFKKPPRDETQNDSSTLLPDINQKERRRLSRSIWRPFLKVDGQVPPQVDTRAQMVDQRWPTPEPQHLSEDFSYTPPPRPKFRGIGALAPAAPKERFSVGDLVDGQWQKGSTWYPGSISAVYSGGRVDIDYADGDQEKMVRVAFVRDRREGRRLRRRSSRGRGRGKQDGAWEEPEMDVVLECGLTQRQLNLLQGREITNLDYELLLLLDEKVEKPASRLCTGAQVDGFEVAGTGAVGEECGICLGEIEEGEVARKLPCCKSSVFHDACVRKWLTSKSSKCPLCTTEVNK